MKDRRSRKRPGIVPTILRTSPTHDRKVAVMNSQGVTRVLCSHSYRGDVMWLSEPSIPPRSRCRRKRRRGLPTGLGKGNATIVALPENLDDANGTTLFLDREGATFHLEELRWGGYRKLDQYRLWADVFRAVRIRLTWEKPLPAMLH
jgi:hypothetical protein